MKILQVVPSLEVGGAETMLVNLTRCLQAATEQAVLSLGPACGSPLEQVLRDAGIPVWFAGKRKGMDLSILPRLTQLIRQFRPDVVHTHLHALPYIWCVPRPQGLGIIHTVHSLARMEARGVSRVLRSLAFRTGVVPVAVSEEVRRTIQELYHLKRVYQIPNGIPISDYLSTDKERSSTRTSNGIAADDVLFICIARLAGVKGHATLLKAFNGLSINCPRAELWIVGDGPLRGELDEMRQTCGRVRLLGARTDVRLLLAAADVFVLASKHEGNPMSVMEAMAAHKPVIATHVGGIPELVDSGVEGILVPPDSPLAFTQAMSELAANCGRRSKLGTAAGIRAKKQFSSSIMASSYIDLYSHTVRESTITC